MRKLVHWTRTYCPNWDENAGIWGWPDDLEGEAVADPVAEGGFALFASAEWSSATTENISGQLSTAD
jgi:hypothetical protein